MVEDALIINSSDVMVDDDDDDDDDDDEWFFLTLAAVKSLLFLFVHVVFLPLCSSTDESHFVMVSASQMLAIHMDHVPKICRQFGLRLPSQEWCSSAGCEKIIVSSWGQ